ncbi:hyccin-like isoform X2 [Amphiura filiformis]|uniref:hyccin-like isoform X2 n=1 Tax=Amphiura filiformis TaxID=82378 RepID=UPI003B214621
MATSRVIKEWLTEYKSLPGSEIANFGNKINSNKELIQELLQQILKSKAEDQDPIFSQLYEFYRSGHLELKRFTLQFAPVLIWQYLTSVSHRENCGRLESLLLGIYNLEVIEPDGTSRVESFTLPTLAKPSIYHEPMSQLALTENVLSYQQSDHWAVTRGPLPQLKAINSQNRFDVLTHVLAEYNADVSYLSSESHESLCNICSRLCMTGFENIAPSSSNPHKLIPNGDLLHGDMQLNINETAPVRIPLCPEFMLEMVNAVYYAMFNGHSEAGIRTMDDIHFRAGYELYTQVLLTTNAIKHSLDVNPSGRPGDGPVGINVAITPATPKMRRSLITNASFKVNRHQKAMIQVTVEGADSPATKEPVTGLDSVDVAVVDKSGTTKVETVEMNRLEDEEETAGGDSVKEVSSGSSGPGSPYRISPASHSREVHVSTNHERVQINEARNEISYETTL